MFYSPFGGNIPRLSRRPHYCCNSQWCLRFEKMKITLHRFEAESRLKVVNFCPILYRIQMGPLCPVPLLNWTHHVRLTEPVAPQDLHSRIQSTIRAHPSTTSATSHITLADFPARKIGLGALGRGCLSPSSVTVSSCPSRVLLSWLGSIGMVVSRCKAVRWFVTMSVQVPFRSGG